MSKCNMTLIKQNTFGLYLAQTHTNADGRILISPLQITEGYTVYIINTYSCQKSNPNYIPINTSLINYLNKFYEDKEKTNFHVIPIRDINIDPTKDYHTPVNLLQYFQNNLSPHRLVSQRAIIQLQDVASILNTDPLPPLYKKTGIYTTHAWTGSHSKRS